MSPTTINIVSIGGLAAQLHRPHRVIALTMEELGIVAAFVIDGKPHVTQTDADNITMHLERTTKSDSR